MRTPRRTTVIILAGAVTLASGAYAIGTQVGGGSAAAGDSDAGARSFGPGEPFDDLADALGVDGAELREALADFGGQHKLERRDEFAAALADALGKSTEEVERALEERQDACGGPGPLGLDQSGLADALDVSPAELRSALRQIFRDGMTDRADDQGELAEFLAKRFNLSVDKVDEALEDALPPPPELRFRGGPGPGFGPPGWHG